MTRYLTFFFLLLVFSVEAQQFPAPGLRYGTLRWCNPFDCFPSGEFLDMSLVSTGDSIEICNRVYYGLTFTKNDPAHKVWLREEDKRYYMKTTPDPCHETLIYDFKLLPGDSFLMDHKFQYYKVIKRDSVSLLDNEFRVRLTFTDMYHWDTIYWVEGIGNLLEGLLPYWDFEGGYSLNVCIKDANGLLWSNENWPLDCDSLLCLRPKLGFDFTCDGHTLSFENSTLNAQIYEWDFGDDSISPDENPVYDYNDPGCYDVVLTARTECFSHIPFRTSRLINVGMPNYWVPVNVPPDNTFQLQMTTDKTAYWLSRNNFYSTKDGFQSIQSTPKPLSSAPSDWRFEVMDFSDEHNGFVLFGPSNYNNKLDAIYTYWTTDGGESWALRKGYGNVQYTISLVKQISPDTAYATSDNGRILKTTDGGNFWSLVNNTYYRLVDIHAYHPDTLLFLGWYPDFPGSFAFKLFFLVEDKIQSVVDISKMIPELNSDDIPTTMFFLDRANGWITTHDGAILHTKDGGTTWQLQWQAKGSLTGIRFKNLLEGIAVGRQHLVLETNDGGLTWKYQMCDRPNSESLYHLNWVGDGSPYALNLFSQILKIGTTPVFPECSEVTTTDKLSPSSHNMMHVFPNPSNGELNIQINISQASTSNILLFDVYGRIVQVLESHVPLSEGINIRSYTFPTLPTGVYIVQLANDRYSKSQLVVIQQ